ncbi:MAG: MOSC domain-containing protein [Burkholderiales bacterium]|jgi:uncharacterized protein YcbX|nr:MOSC domain-containing protein [Burkholderiales bacterium]
MQAVVSALNVYPLKGAAGIPVDGAEVRVTGLVTGGIADREWMAVDPQGVFVTQREFPVLARVGTAVVDGTVVLSAPGRSAIVLRCDAAGASRDVRVWQSEVRGHDAGDDAARWLSDHVGTPLRIVRFDPAQPRPCNPDYAGDSGAHVRFADGYPLLVIGQASLDHLNAKLAARGAAALPMNRFRPNLVLEGLDAHDEDHLDTIDVGGVVLKPVKPCARCQVTTVDQSTGRTADEPLVTLSTYRRDDRRGGILFGVNAIVVAGAGRSIAVGDRAVGALRF